MTASSILVIERRPTKRKLRLAVAVSFALHGATAFGQTTLELPAANAQRASHVIMTGSGTSHSVARLWNEAVLEAIRRDVPRVTVHARNLFHTSAAMYDAWAAYSPDDLPLIHDETATPQDASLRQAREEAISYAAYRLLSHRFALSPGHAASQQNFDQLMLNLGFDPTLTDLEGKQPYAVGNRVAAGIIEHGLNDGSNETANHADPTGYVPVNLPMLVILPGAGGLVDINAWQPLIPPGGSGVQGFLTPHWDGIMPFALESGSLPDPGPPPRLGGQGSLELMSAVIEMIDYSSHLDPNDPTLINLSPAVRGNNPIGSNSGTGHGLNPVTGQPYPDQLVKLADWGRVLAEFWEDGPASSTPPGHWTEIANLVSDATEERRLTGIGPVVDKLEWDIKLYLTLHGALHDSAIVAWQAKREYNSSRPITLVRGMAELGQSSDPDAANYHPDGLPLVDDLIETITIESSAPGERHEALSPFVGEIALYAWRGHPDDPGQQAAGVDWIRAVEWRPYQAIDFMTPPFPGYVSAHTVFSRAAAEVLTTMTGSPYFPGGLAEYHAEPDTESGLNFELGPSEPLRLQWASYFDASDESGLSRVYGGIHPAFDDFPARILGQTVGQQASDHALALFAPIEDVPMPENRPLAVPFFSPGSIGLLGLLLLALGLQRLRPSQH
jgi:hypothetical protein